MRLNSYIFIKDYEKTKINRTLKKRTYLLGVLAILIAWCFILLEFTLAAIVCVVIGSFLICVGKLILSREKDKGSIPSQFIIENDELITLGQKFKINELKDLKFNLVNYEDGPSYNQFKSAEGNENEIEFRLNEKILRMNFFIPTSKHYIDLIEYLEEKKIDFSAKRGFPWT